MSSFSQFEIKFKIKGANNSEIYLGHHYGNERILIDTIRTNKKGKAVYKGNTELKKGIYLAVVPNHYYFEFLVADSKRFSLQTNVEDFVYNMKTKGCKENLIFNNYQRFMMSQFKKRKNLETRRKQNINNMDSLILIEEESEKIFQQNEAGWKEILTTNSGTFFSKIIMAMVEVEIPENISSTRDSALINEYYQKHFFDNIDFSENGLLNSSIYFKRIYSYFTGYYTMHPDSIIEGARFLLNKLEDYPVFREYTGNFILDFQEHTGNMSMEKVFMEIAGEFYLTEKIQTDSLNNLYIREKLIRNVPNQYGSIGKNLVLESTSGEYFSLHQVNADFTILLFYEPDCGFCKTEVPAINKLYQKYQKSGIEVYAVNTNTDKEEWINYIEENDLNWINTWDSDNISNYQYLYFVDITPTIYLLNKNKEIIGKKVNSRYLENFFRNYYGY
ncbi:MAG: redoxin domain-containing protein [Bacteroidales bacterium]|nr:redoxin domain-containing protein [Bacteroidales bacterium]